VYNIYIYHLDVPIHNIFKYLLFILFLVESSYNGDLMKIRVINSITRNKIAAVMVIYIGGGRKSGAIIIEYLSGRKQLNATVAVSGDRLRIYNIIHIYSNSRHHINFH